VVKEHHQNKFIYARF